MGWPFALPENDARRIRRLPKGPVPVGIHLRIPAKWWCASTIAAIQSSDSIVQSDPCVLMLCGCVLMTVSMMAGFLQGDCIRVIVDKIHIAFRRGFPGTQSKKRVS